MKNQYPIKILGIDPGTNILGYAILEITKKDTYKVHQVGVVKLGKYQDPYKKLGEIFKKLTTLIQSHRPQIMAVEAPFFGKNVQSMLKLGRAQGVAIAAGINTGLDVFEYSPKKIKLSITGNGNANKEQVMAMLQSILQTNLSKQYLDATDALAAALCHYYQSNSPLGKSKRYSGWKDFLADNPNKIS